MAMRHSAILRKSWACASAVALGLGIWSSPPAEARESGPQHIDVAAGSLPDVIAELAREMHVSIGAEGALPRIRTPKVRGTMGVAEALRRLLSGTGYVARQVGETAWRIERAPSAPARTERSEPRPVPPPQPILVTATKQPLALLSLPAAVSVARLTDVERSDPGSASATVSSQLDGLALTSLGPGRNRMFLRGIADSAFSGESQSTVAVVLDDARLTYSAPDPDIRLVDIERVEVLKGPQGSLYGTGALGGIYRLVSRSADLDDASLTVSGGGVIAAHGEPGYSGSVIANLPLRRDFAALRLVGYAAEEPGWIDTGTRKDSNSTKVSGARAMLGVVPASGWRLDLTGFAQWLQTRDSAYVYTSGSFSRPDQIAEPHDNDLTHVAVRLSGGMGDVELMLASAMTWHDVGDTLDATIGAEGLGLSDPRVLLDLRSYRVWDNDLRLRGRLGALNWLAGVAYVEARQTLLETLTGFSGGEVIADDDRRTSDDTAVYFDLSLPITDTLSLDGGARLFHSAIHETRILSSGRVTRERRKSGMTPSLALAWQPNASRLIYLRYGSAFRQGGSEISESGAIEPLKGDELASLEAGWRERLPGGGRMEINAWYTRWEDVQSDVLGSDGLIETTNAGNARIIGVEGSLDMVLGPGWRMETGANFTGALLMRSALGYEVHDRHLPVVPEYTLRASLRHDFALGPADVWAQVRLRYIGPSRMSFDPALDRQMGKLLESGIEVHAVLDDWQFSLQARNLFAGKGNTFAYGNPFRYRTMPQFTPQRPLTVGLSVSRSF
ncbi:TonB-dependent receptor domain-containing protein [Novosphingobium mangrovi (ex Huang et al. 2023)]|uniref:TonB-dependent receptor n=1 Tax=Novosphingobium mangrovi (ex Huang et al. 2023) TaxID=2976432 RepID=A0ABT2I076_9SPHN|nr:TonB-dependent receptor [Novosphingobium mangrovi (ex Huang et al. 2023)]MCT2398194.1 TonB-dependent receptor [Novosphingobium mangrovi (ex Huang et al. 2023)]